jgi:hypothetical protein
VITHWGLLISCAEPFPRNDKSALPDRDISASFTGAQADGGAVNVRDNQTEKGDESKTTSRSIKGLTRIAGATIKLPMDMTFCSDSSLSQCAQALRGQHSASYAQSHRSERWIESRWQGTDARPIKPSFNTKGQAGTSVGRMGVMPPSAGLE